MLKIAIVDDSEYYIENIKKLLSENIKDEYETSEFLTSDSFIKTIVHKKFDIVFLDIILDQKDGIQIGKILNEKHPQTYIIFVSSNPQYFKDVYKVTHSYFLTKEFEKERFSDAVKKVLGQLNKEFILLNTKGENKKIYLSGVLYFESNLRHTILHFTDGTVGEYSINLKHIEKKLPYQIFVRTHKSFIVNMNYIEKYDRQNVFTSTNKVVPISRNYSDNAREKITCYLGGVM